MARATGAQDMYDDDDEDRSMELIVERRLII